MKRALAALLLLSPATAAAQIRSQPEGSNPHAHAIDYAPDQVVTLETAPGYQLALELAPDEHIENVAVGDSAAWQVSANRRGDRLFIKPLQGNSATNMVVITDARSYLFELAPLSAPQPDMAYSVRFRYPSGQPAEPEPEATANTSHGRYRLTGARALQPAGIHDDGVHTYIEWPADAPLPATYAVDDRGKESLVNGMIRDGLLVIDSVHPRLVFRIDKHKASATRTVAAAPQ